jgi:hypothetical protein
MRTALVLAAVLGAITFVSAQERPVPPEEVPPRFGLPYRVRTYPQATPKQALESVLAAADRGDVNYLVAHLLDPAFVDARVADRSQQFEPTIADDLARLRDFQRRNPDQTPSNARLPDDPVRFQARVIADARTRAFNQIVQDVREKLIDDPEVLKDLRRFNRQGTFPEAGGDITAKVGLPDLKDRAVFLKKIGDRWYIENRQTDDKVPGPKKE